MPVILKQITHNHHYRSSFSEEDATAFPAHAHCPICGGAGDPDVMAELGHPKWRQTVRLVQCADCEALYYHNPPTEKFLADYYETTWNTKSGESVDGPIREMRKKVGRHMAGALRDLGVADKNAPVLDVGCGTGDQMAGLSESGFTDVWGTEMSPYRLAMTEARFPGRVFAGGYDAVPEDRKFDVIYSNHVMEHLYHPREVVGSLKQHLTDQGVVVIAVPDAWYEPIVNQVLFLPHLHSFCARSLSEMAHKHGMKALFWTSARRGELVTAFVTENSAINPAAGKFLPLEELTGRVAGSHRQRIRQPWVGDAGQPRTLAVRKTYCSRNDQEAEDAFRILGAGELMQLKLKWALAGALRAFGMKKMPKKLVHESGYMTIEPQSDGDDMIAVCLPDGRGAFHIK